MLKNFFNKNGKKIENVFSPLQGTVVPLSSVPDSAFAEKMIGDGIAVIPKDGKVVSPVKGQIIQVFPTKHAIGIKSEKGLELLIHVGLDTVELNGEGFDPYVTDGQTVNIGDPLLTVDLEYLKNHDKNVICPIIITNMEQISNIDQSNFSEINHGDLLLKCLIRG